MEERDDLQDTEEDIVVFAVPEDLVFVGDIVEPKDTLFEREPCCSISSGIDEDRICVAFLLAFSCSSRCMELHSAPANPIVCSFVDLCLFVPALKSLSGVGNGLLLAMASE